METRWKLNPAILVLMEVGRCAWRSQQKTGLQCNIRKAIHQLMRTKKSGENQLRNDKTQQTSMIDVLRTVAIEKKSGRKPHSLLSYKRLLLCTLQTSLAFKARTMVDSFTGFTALHTVSVLYQQPQVKCNLRRQLECTSNIRTYVQPITSIAYPLRLRDSYA